MLQRHPVWEVNLKEKNKTLDSENQSRTFNLEVNANWVGADAMDTAPCK